MTRRPPRPRRLRRCHILIALCLSATSLACASMSRTVRENFSRSLRCPYTDVDVVELRQLSTEEYQVYLASGCGQELRYRCSRDAMYAVACSGQRY